MSESYNTYVNLMRRQNSTESHTVFGVPTKTNELSPFIETPFPLLTHQIGV